jgi:CRISPR-associated protein (TIGR02584 family)
MRNRTPEQFPRRILLAACGLTPQVVTETIYALAVARPTPVVPSEVHLLATRESAQRARLSLLSEDPGWFHRLRQDYQLPRIRFDDSTIHELGGPGGDAFSDIRTVEENEGTADAITELVRELTSDPEAALHVSLAGGRKTMGFYLGYALSLFARPQDRLSHVLISTPYESHPEFFYPTPRPRIIYTPPPDQRPLDTSAAQVTLAEIPFVRLRHGLPRELLEGRSTFLEVVRAAQLAVGPPELVFHLRRRRVRAGQKEIELPPAELAFFAWIGRRRVRGLHGPGCPTEGYFDREYAREFLEEYRRIVGPMGPDERTAHALRGGMDKGYFLQRRSKLARALREALGVNAAPYLVQTVGRRPDTRYELALAPEQIRFADEHDQEIRP